MHKDDWSPSYRLNGGNRFLHFVKAVWPIILVVALAVAIFGFFVWGVLVVLSYVLDPVHIGHFIREIKQAAQ